MKQITYILLLFVGIATACSTGNTSKNANSAEEEGYSVLQYEDFTALEGIFMFYFKDKKGNELSFEFRPMEDSPIEFLSSLYTEDLMPNEAFIGKNVKLKFKEAERENEFTGEMEMVKVLEDVKAAK